MARESKVWLTKAEVMVRIGCARSTLDLWMKDGKGPKMHQLPNQEWRCAETDLDSWFDQLVLS